MEFLLGMLGALAVMGAFGLGAAMGRRSRTAAGLTMPSEEETRRIRDQQQAFQRLQNYTVEDAYGLNRG